MATVHAKAFRVTEASLPILQCFIAEEIPTETKFVLASGEGYVFFSEEPTMHDQAGMIRIPHFAMLSYYDVEYEGE